MTGLLSNPVLIHILSDSQGAPPAAGQEALQPPMAWSGEPRFQQVPAMRAMLPVKAGRGLFEQCLNGVFLEKFLLSRLWANVTQMLSGRSGGRESI